MPKYANMTVPAKIMAWTTAIASLIVFVNIAVAVDNRYAKQNDFTVFKDAAITSMVEINLNFIQYQISSIKAIPEDQRKQWQVVDLLRLETEKERLTRKLPK